MRLNQLMVALLLTMPWAAHAALGEDLFALPLEDLVRLDVRIAAGTTNPRAALVWDTTPALTSKLIFGEAFRAPSFAELYARNTAVVGNPDLKPEKLRNSELDFSWHPTTNLAWDLNFYRYHIRDFIEFAPDPSMGGIVRAQNVGRYRGQGIETELRYQLSMPVQLLANFSTANMKNADTGAPAARCRATRPICAPSGTSPRAGNSPDKSRATPASTARPAIRALPWPAPPRPISP